MRAVTALLLASFCACSAQTDGSTGDNSSSGSAPEGSSTSTDESGSHGRSSSRHASSSAIPLPQGTISGRVFSPSGDFGVFDAVVGLEFDANGTTTRRSTHTRFDGSFTLFNIPAGSYTLTATRGIYSGTGTAVIATEGEQVMDASVIMGASNVRFEVVTGFYDDIGDIVTGLGFVPRTIEGRDGTDWLDTVTTEDALTNSHALLLNCGLEDGIWDRTDLETKRQALRDYVAGGKSLYISDWAYNVMEWLFPEALTFYGDDGVRDDAKKGEVDTVLADVPDETLRKLVGPTIHITYDLGYWVIITGVSATPESGLTVDVIARGTVHAQGDIAIDDVPLAVIVHHGAGRVIYTTFHNEAQLDETVAAVLRYMIMSL